MGKHKHNPEPHRVKTPKKILKRIAMYNKKEHKQKGSDG